MKIYDWPIKKSTRKGPCAVTVALLTLNKLPATAGVLLAALLPMPSAELPHRHVEHVGAQRGGVHRGWSNAFKLLMDKASITVLVQCKF